MEFQVLGSIRIRRDGREAGPSGRLQRVLLGMLLLQANRPVLAEVLVEAMWGDRIGHRDRSNLHVHIHRLRAALGDPQRLISTVGGYVLAVQPGELDAERFESLLADSASADPHEAARLLRVALGLWCGEAYSDVEVPALADEGARLADRRSVAVERFFSAELACGRHAEVIPELREAVRRDPLHEQWRAKLMLALYRSGQQARALEVYQGARRVLVDELGQEPGPELRQMHQRILEGAEDCPASPTETPVPAQLPHDVPGFLGRTSEMSSLDKLEPDDGPAVITAITGTGGVGKTALAVHWAHQARDRFPDGQLYVDLRGYGPGTPMSPDEALTGFLRELGVDVSDIPDDPAERAARFRTLTAGKRMLLIVDNASSVEQVRPLLPGVAAGLVLVTSRDSLAGLVARDGAQRVFVDRLGENDAVDLLSSLISDRIDAEPDAAAVLAARCAGLPLALRVAAELVSTRPGLGLTELVAELDEEQHALDVLDAGGDRATAVRAVFSWSYQQLAAEPARLFRYFGLHPGIDGDAPTMAALLGVELPAARRHVVTLRRAHLLEEAATGRYRMHDLLRGYASELAMATDSAADRDAAVGRLYDHYVGTAANATRAVETHRLVPRHPAELPAATRLSFVEKRDAVRWLDVERANLVKIAVHATRHGRPGITMLLAKTLRRYLSLSGYHFDAQAIYRHALTAAHDLGDLVEEGHANRYLGSLHRRYADFATAWDFMRNAHRCYREAGARRDAQFQLINLANLAAWRGRYRDALECLDEALALSHELGAQVGRVGRVGTLTYFGFTHRYLGDDRRALEYLAEATGFADPANPRECLDAEATMGIVYDRLGEYDRALTHLRRAWDIALSENNHLMQCYLAPLGHVYWRLGRRGEGFAFARRCLSVSRAVGERLTEMLAEDVLGVLHRLAGGYDESLAHHNAALRIAKVGPAPYMQAQAHLGIGDVHGALGEMGPARDHWEQAREIFQQIGSADASHAAGRLEV